LGRTAERAAAGVDWRHGPMSAPVSVVIPSLDDRELLERHLPPLLAEFERRAASDECVLVDDTGERVLGAWCAQRFPSVRVVERERNGGFGRALGAGIEAARHELVFCMNPDVLVHAGFLEPLVACMQSARVHSVAPRVLLNGAAERVESLLELEWDEGVAKLRQRGLEGEAAQHESQREPVAFAIGGTCMLRRSEFLAAGGLDPLYEPFYFEDLDLGWRAWRAGRTVAYEPRSVVEHHHRGSIGKRIPKERVRAIIERNRLLFQWKFLDDARLARQHVEALYRQAIDAWLRGRREELVWLLLALERQDQAHAARRALPPATLEFEDIRARARPGSGALDS